MYKSLRRWFISSLNSSGRAERGNCIIRLMFKNWFWYLLTLWYWTSYFISLSFSSLCLMVFKFFPFEAAWYGRSISVSSGIRVNQIINFLIIYPFTTQILYLYHVGNRAIPNSQSFGEEYVNQCTWGQLLRCLGKGRPSINVTSPSVPTCFSSLRDSSYDLVTVLPAESWEQ